MPRLKRMSRDRCRLAELDEIQRMRLETGHGSGGELDTLETFRPVWEQFGEDILAEWIQEYPGTRPFGWWLCEHGQERPLLDNEWTRKWGTPENLANWRALSPFGFLHDHPHQEAEADVLARLGELTAEERRILGRPAWRPPKEK